MNDSMPHSRYTTSKFIWFEGSLISISEILLVRTNLDDVVGTEDDCWVEITLREGIELNFKHVIKTKVDDLVSFFLTLKN